MRPDGTRTVFSMYHPFFIVNLIPPALYFFIRYLTNPSYQWKSTDYLFFLPVILEVGLRLFKFSFFAKGTQLSESALGSINFWLNSLELFAAIFSVVVILLVVKSLKKYEQNLRENYSEVETRSLTWLRNILLVGLALSFLWIIITISDYGIIPFNLTLAQLSLMALSLMIYWIGYSMIIRQELLETPIFAISNSQDQSPTETSELSTNTDNYYKQLKDLMSINKLYQNESLNMTVLSEKTGLSNSYLSQIINQKEGKNFFDFVNGYRIEEVKEKIIDPKFEHYTILAIAQEAGFKSKSTFNIFFKKTTGKTPSEYRKLNK